VSSPISYIARALRALSLYALSLYALSLCALFLCALFLCALSAPLNAVYARPHHVKTDKSEGGWRLLVDGEPTMIIGMNWGYIPIGENYAWVLWQQPDEVIREALSAEMPLLRDMGVNAIRQYPDIPPKWVEWIYERYGIYTIINHTLGRYGASVEGVWVPETDYSDPALRASMMAELDELVERYRDSRGVLMYLLGNENNYGLSWTSFEAEDLPDEERDVARARPLYTLFGEVATRLKAADPHHPVAIANGDLGYIDLIAEHCGDVDIMGSNVYRGASSRDLFDRVAERLDRPFLYSEFGADAFNARLGREDASAQAEYLRQQWREIYEHSHGKGRSGVAIGGLIFQWSDGWWKHKQVEDLDRHDETASWANEGYPHDFVPGHNNMNEEWFGIAAKGPPDERGLFRVYPRPAYYLLKRAFSLSPYREGLSLKEIERHFEALKSVDFSTPYIAAQAGANAERAARLRVSRLSLQLESGSSAGGGRAERSAESVVGHTQSAYIDVSAQPSAQISARVSVNVLGQVAQNRLNPIFYENRGRGLRPSSAGRASSSDASTQDLSALERVALYQAELEIDEPLFNLQGYYRVGHYHWGDEGDIFGLYPEAYYGANIDIYNAAAPIGATLSGKGALKRWKLAFGPQLYWGANPGLILKYHRRLGSLTLSFLHHEDVGQSAETGSSNAMPIRKSRRSSLSFGYATGGLKIDLGGLFSGSDRVGESFLWTSPTSGRGYRDTGYLVHDDEIAWLDTLGAKARITYSSGRWQAYAHGVLKGLVSSAGADPRQRFTGWTLNESGSGNQLGGLAGVALQLGALQLAPHLLYQRPLIGPMDRAPDRFNPASGIYYPALRARNQLDDPFAVLDNRETLAGELLFVYDPTPGTWFWQWDNPLREDAPFAASLNLIYRHQPTSRDARFGVDEGGRFFAFDGAPRARDLWEVKGRLISKLSSSRRLSAELYAGEAQARGIDERVITRAGGQATLHTRRLRAQLSLAFNDWGPYDYHRDYNLTYPLQAGGDVAYVIGMKTLELSAVRLGLRGLYRTLNQHSEGYRTEPQLSGDTGLEWELTSYLHIDL